MKTVNKKVGEYWSKVTSSVFKQVSEQELKLRWWQSDCILRHINKVVCGEDVPGASQGLINLVKMRARKKLPFATGISVGGGAGQKEMHLLKENIVQHIDLYEISQDAIRAGNETARNEHLEDRIRFVYGDALETVTGKRCFDFVHWNNSLHHMHDVDRAVAWSKRILKPGGLFYMDDYVGASRFQWSDEQLWIATRVRQVFESSKYLENPKKNPLRFLVDNVLPTAITRPTIRNMLNTDPSEAADSGRIIASIQKYFPNAEIILTGGVVYHSVLNDMLNNFDEEEDKLTLDLLMVIDEICARLGHTHYGVALAFKDGVTGGSKMRKQRFKVMHTKQEEIPQKGDMPT